ncbi:MAG: HDIG domain-containing protein [Verrucomicrobia bacterium]|nr:MAG: HDIG domain-containing protein [Verrucomicrobiota bacterium]
MGFWDAFKRWKLAQQGLSSGKKRRVYAADERFSAVLAQSLWVRWLLMLAFVMTLVSLVLWQPHDSNGKWSAEVWQQVVSAVSLGVTALIMLRLNHREALRRNGVVLLLLGGLLVHLGVLCLISYWVDANQWRSELKLLLIPFALAPMVHSVLLGRRAGTFSAIFVSIAGTLLVPSSEMVIYLILSLSVCMAVVMLAGRVRKRAQLLRAGIYSGGISLVFALIYGRFLNSDGLLAQEQLAFDGVMCLLAFGVGFFTALVIGGLLPLLEGMFSITTNISWLELCDLNHPLLKKMQLDAPGTFHHSLVMAALAEAAAESIGANAVLCRACAYFHDIGKLKKPEYFIENQADGAENPHHALTPTMSALIIIAHVKDGVDLAMKYKLNPRIIDAILEHHGDSLVAYFYQKCQQLKALEEGKVDQGLENAEDLPQVDEENFRYPGPRPRSRETGILSLADAIESASRTLKKPNPARIRSLVDDIVRARLADGQLDECPLSMRELTKIRESFASTLRSMMHSRISYTKSEEGVERKASSSRSTMGRYEYYDRSTMM